MCGRMTNAATNEEIATQLEVDEVDGDANKRNASYNVAPTQPIIAIDEKEDSRRLTLMRWGLIPSWSKDAKAASKMINARAEGVFERPAYRSAFAKRRCLIPVDGFYEWERLTGSKKKQPWRFVRKDGQLLVFAGIWETWKNPDDPDGTPVITCSIVTTEANPDMPIHNRMPRILEADEWTQWLGADKDSAMTMLHPPEAGILSSVPVSDRVNSVANNDPGLIEPQHTDR
jgi:putative SOS response-associated peptidase YedK